VQILLWGISTNPPSTLEGCVAGGEMKFCRNCGERHAPETECVFIWQICGNCGNKFKTAPDVPYLSEVANVICGQCGIRGNWRFEDEPMKKERE
jgi:hypothetical protein